MNAAEHLEKAIEEKTRKPRISLEDLVADLLQRVSALERQNSSLMDTIRKINTDLPKRINHKIHKYVVRILGEGTASRQGHSSQPTWLAANDSAHFEVGNSLSLVPETVDTSDDNDEPLHFSDKLSPAANKSSLTPAHTDTVLCYGNSSSSILNTRKYDLLNDSAPSSKHPSLHALMLSQVSLGSQRLEAAHPALNDDAHTALIPRTCQSDRAPKPLPSHDLRRTVVSYDDASFPACRTGSSLAILSKRLLRESSDHLQCDDGLKGALTTDLAANCQGCEVSPSGLITTKSFPCQRLRKHAISSSALHSHTSITSERVFSISGSDLSE